MTSIVGYIAVQDLTKASDIIRSRTFDAFFPLVLIAVLYFLISWALIQALEYLESSLPEAVRSLCSPSTSTTRTSWLMRHGRAVPTSSIRLLNISTH